jgi:UDPglucose--hexose-1-phosphate uridylyltransferase
VVENPDHGFSFAFAPADQMLTVLEVFGQRLRDLRGDKRFRHIIVFRNHGAAAGASLSHPHSQIIALSIIPSFVREKLDAAHQHYLGKERCIFCDLIEQELALPERRIYHNDHFVVLSPFAARFPFEVQIYPTRHMYDYTLMSREQQLGLIDAMQFVLSRYHTELSDPPYNMVLQTAPNRVPRPGRPEYWGTIEYDYHWHIELFPRLTKMAGFEHGTGFYINPVSPEEAATYLRGDGPPTEGATTH